VGSREESREKELRGRDKFKRKSGLTLKKRGWHPREKNQKGRERRCPCCVTNLAAARADCAGFTYARSSVEAWVGRPATTQASEVEVAVDAPETADGVVEDAVVGRGEILLDVAGIVVVGDVDDFQAAEKLDAMTAKSEIERILEFEIEARKGGKTAGFVAGADVVPVFVELGIREAGVNVEDGNELEFVGEANDAPEEHAVRSVTGKRAILIGADDRVRIVAEELVVVVEVAEGAGVDVAGDEAGAFGGIPAKHGEKFVVGLRPGVEELEVGGGGRLGKKVARDDRAVLVWEEAWKSLLR
jgi:hypothetical protein